jgi:hypothetical protein
VSFQKYTLLLLLSGFFGLAHGATMSSYNLNENNIGFDSATEWGSITVSYVPTAEGSDCDNYDCDIRFSVTLIDDSFTSYGDLGANFGMQNFFFNSSMEISATNILYESPVEWNFLSERIYNAGGGYGKFGLEYSGTGDTRTSYLSFTIHNYGDDLLTYALENDEGYAFATHIADFDDGYGNLTSGKFSASLSPSISPVPIPAAAWLFGSALLGFVGFARRRSV